MKEYYLDTSNINEWVEVLKKGDRVYLSGTIYTARDAAHKKIVALLKENLNEQGVKVEAVEVTVAPHQFEARDEEQRERSNEEQQTSRRRFIDVNGDEEEQFDEAAAIARDIMMSGGNRMDIRA